MKFSKKGNTVRNSGSVRFVKSFGTVTVRGGTVEKQRPHEIHNLSITFTPPGHNVRRVRVGPCTADYQRLARKFKLSDNASGLIRHTLGQADIDFQTIDRIIRTAQDVLDEHYQDIMSHW